MKDTRRKILGAAAAALALGVLPMARAQRAPLLVVYKNAVLRQLLRERPKASGPAVPGMPIGAPGMEQGTAQRYATIAFDDRGAWVFERH